MKKTILYIAVIIFLPVITWSGYFRLEEPFMVDGIFTSSVIVFVAGVISSVISYQFFSFLRSKPTSLPTYLLSIIMAEGVVLSLDGFIGPMAGVLIGIATGFACYAVIGYTKQKDRN